MKALKQLSVCFVMLQIATVIEVKAQTWLWARQNYDLMDTLMGDDEGFAISSDSRGDAYSTGVVFGTQTLGDTLIGNKNEQELYIWKHDRSGNHIWALQFGVPMASEGKSRIKTTPLGESYVAGHSPGGITCNAFNNPALGKEDVFVLKVDTSGFPVWLRSGGGKGQDFCHGIAVDYKEQVFLTGHVTDSARFGTEKIGGGPAQIAQLGPEETGYLSCLDAAGNWLWAKSFIPLGPKGRCKGMAVDADTSGFVYVAGTFQDSMRIDSTRLLAPEGGLHYFFAQFNEDGDLVWLKKWLCKPGRSILALTPKLSIADLYATESGNFYITGKFQDTLVMDNFSLISPFGEGSFLASLDSKGDLLWIAQGSGWQPMDIELYPGRFIGICGYFQDTMHWDGRKIAAKFPNTTDAVYSFFDNYGNHLTSSVIGSSLHDRMNGMTYSAGFKPHMIVTGMIEDTVSFTPHTLYGTPGWQSFAEGYVARIKVPCCRCVPSPIGSGGGGGGGGGGGDPQNQSWQACLGDTLWIAADSGYAGYLWSTGDTSAIIQLTGSVPSLYYMAWDSTDTVYSAIETITFLAGPLAQITSMDHCLGSPWNWTAQVDPPGDYSYNWSFGDGQTAQGASTSHIYSQAGTYQVSIIVDGMGSCDDTTGAEVRVIEAPPLLAWPTDTLICDTTGVVLQAPAGWTSYLWQDGTTEDHIVVAASGQYSVQLGHPCADTSLSTNIITIPPPYPGELAGEDQVICLGDSVQIFANNPGPDWVFAWLPGPGLTDTANVNPWAFPAESIDYFIYATDTSIGCFNRSIDTVHIKVEIPLFPPYNPTMEYQFCPGEILSIGVEPWPGYSYEWLPKSGLQDPFKATTSLAPSEPSAYSLVVTNDTILSEACRSTEIQIYLNSNGCTPPTVVSPNGDGQNDHLDLGSHAQPPAIWIYDRWGHLVYESDAYQNNWPAQNNNLPATVYWYVVRMKSSVNILSDAPSSYIGELMLIR